jgi:uncharacterized protein (TIGR00369 family)
MIKKQPGSNHCFICGLQNPVGLKMDFYITEPGQVRAEISIPSHFEGYPGVVHGGIIAAVLDETGGRALMEEPTRFMVTAQLNVRYRKPVHTETPLAVMGVAGQRRGRAAEAHAEIHAENGDLLAEAELLLVDIPEHQLEEIDLPAMGWRVYPDKEA